MRGRGTGPVGGGGTRDARTRGSVSKGELRNLMLETGGRLLHEEGIETFMNNLTFKRVFDRVERDTGRHLTNASVIKRIWDNQADYQADVLVAVAGTRAAKWRPSNPFARCSTWSTGRRSRGGSGA